MSTWVLNQNRSVLVNLDTGAVVGIPERCTDEHFTDEAYAAMDMEGDAGQVLFEGTLPECQAVLDNLALRLGAWHYPAAPVGLAGADAPNVAGADAPAVTAAE